MGRLQTLFLIIVVRITVPAAAEWGLLLGTAGFQGAMTLGLTYQLSVRHALELSLGQYAIENQAAYQVNFGYTYTPARIQLGPMAWAPVDMSALLIYALDNQRYFVVSPSRFPTPGYYEPTALRAGLSLGTELAILKDRLRLIYQVVILDNGIVAALNNRAEDVNYFLSAGLKLRFDF